MAGHSKWANTKHRKAAQDAKRGKIFTKIIRELVTAARLGGGDPASNPRLRAAVDKALSNNMTRDTLNRAIARGVGGDEDANMETIIYFLPVQQKRRDLLRERRRRCDHGSGAGSGRGRRCDL